MIFSLLKVRNKTAGALVGIACGLACIWVVASWQKISVEALLGMLLNSILLLVGIMLAALAVVAVFTIVKKVIQHFTKSEP